MGRTDPGVRQDAVGTLTPRPGAPVNPIGPLVPADEQFCHQITDTFGVVGSSDLAWTEKVCAMAVARAVAWPAARIS